MGPAQMDPRKICPGQMDLGQLGRWQMPHLVCFIQLRTFVVKGETSLPSAKFKCEAFSAT